MDYLKKNIYIFFPVLGGEHTLLSPPRQMVCSFVSDIKCIDLDGITMIVVVIRIHTSK